MLNKIISIGLVVAANGSMVMKNEKIAEWEKASTLGMLNRDLTSIRNSPATCDDATNTVNINGEVFDCQEVDFLSFVSLNEMEIKTRPHQATGMASADIWGWRSEQTNNEYTLHCMDNGVAIFDSTDPINPCLVGKLPAVRRADPWCDIKVWDNTMYVVKDSRGGDWANDTDIGGQVFDLLQLDDIVCEDLTAPLDFKEDHVWNFHGSAHNVYANTQTGFLYTMGGDTCNGGIVVMDVKNDRIHPEYVSCIGGDGYTHDMLAIIYDGPDTRFQGKEIIFAFNEDTLTIWDAEDKFNPVMLSRLTYPSQAYTHQGWLNDDMTLILMDDELNERCGSIAPENRTGSCVTHPLGPLNGITKTSTIVVDIGKMGSLTNPIFTGTFLHKDDSIDHNLYVFSLIHRLGLGGNGPLPEDQVPSSKFAYCNNYLAGLRILDISSGDVTQFKEVGFFDIAPEHLEDELTYLGAWSGYLHPSGVYAVSSIERGLFFLKPRMVYDKSGLEIPEEPLLPIEWLYMIYGALAMLGTIFVFVGTAALCCRRASTSQTSMVVTGEELEKGKAKEVSV